MMGQSTLEDAKMRCLVSLVLWGALWLPLAAAEPVRPMEVIKLFDGKSLGDCYTFLQDTKYEDPR